MTLEAVAERADRVIARAAGWFVAKLIFVNMRGAPDRLYARARAEDVCPHCGAGRLILMEWKKQGLDATRQQAKRHEELRAAGIEVHVVDSVEQAEAIRNG